MRNQILIGIHSGKQITLKTYLRAWKVLRSMSEDQRRTTELVDSLCTWYPVTAQECYRQYISGVHDRINLRMKGQCLISNMIKP